jgi:hypothetical protein
MTAGFSTGHFYHTKISRVLDQGGVRSFFIQGIGVSQMTGTASKSGGRVRPVGIRHLLMAEQTPFPGKPFGAIQQVFLQYQHSRQD